MSITSGRGGMRSLQCPKTASKLERHCIIELFSIYLAAINCGIITWKKLANTASSSPLWASRTTTTLSIRHMSAPCKATCNWCRGCGWTMQSSCRNKSWLLKLDSYTTELFRIYHLLSIIWSGTSTWNGPYRWRMPTLSLHWSLTRPSNATSS